MDRREAMQFGMIIWEVPRQRHPQTYSGKGWKRAGFAAPKPHIAPTLSCTNQDLESETLASKRSSQR